MSLEPLPDITEHFAADARFDGLTARHHAARRRQDAGAKAREDFRHVVSAGVDAAARTADALDPGDELLTVRPVLEKEPQCFHGGGGLGDRRGFLDELEALDVALVL